MHFECNFNNIVVTAAYIPLLTFLFIYIYLTCEYYFLPLLDKFSKFMGISKAVSSATLLSLGSSMPGILISTTDILLTNGDNNKTSFGFLVGSTMFNNLVLVGAILFKVKQNENIDIEIFSRNIIIFKIGRAHV